MRNSRWSSFLVWSLVVSLGASTGRLAALEQVEPPPLPPDTVNQVGLRWHLKTIGTKGVKKPFRFSLCEGRYLAAEEVSRPCHPSRVSTVSGGHNAPYVFSSGHGTFLPKGLVIDGNGILKGDDPKLLDRVKELPLCVRQLDVERCKPVYIDKHTEHTVIEPDPIADAIDSGSGPPKKGIGGGAKAFAVLLAGGAAVAAGVAVAAAAEGAGGSSGSCTPPTQNVLSVCSTQGGGSSACTSAIAAANAYCRCRGSSGFSTATGACR